MTVHHLFDSKNGHRPHNAQEKSAWLPPRSLAEMKYADRHGQHLLHINPESLVSGDLVPTCLPYLWTGDEI